MENSQIQKIKGINQKRFIRIYILLLLLILSQSGYPQFLNKDAAWITGLRCPDPDCTWSYINNLFVNDSTIDGINYSIVETWGGLFALRESNNMVFYKGLESDVLEIDTLERVMYNFNLQINDTFDLIYRYSDTINWIVTSIDSILIGSEYKKKLSLQELTQQIDKKECSLIEDIGSSYGPLWFLYITQKNYEAELYCYIVNNIKLYGKCKSVGINEVNSDIKPLVFFDAMNRQLKVNLPEAERYTLNIYTLTGIKIFSQRLLGNQVINTGNFKKGLYIAELKTERFRHCEKIFIR